MVKIQKAHKILLDISPEIERQFVSWCGAARWSYNFGLGRKKESFEETGKSPGSYALMKEVVALKKDEILFDETAGQPAGTNPARPGQIRPVGSGAL